MGWVKVEHTLPDHPKILALGDDAPLGFSIYVAAICWSYQHNTDGLIPERATSRLLPGLENRADCKRLADLLVTVGLFEAMDGGYLIHDYADHQQTREEREDLTRKRSEAGRRGGLSTAGKSYSNGSSKSYSNGSSRREESRREDKEKVLAPQGASKTCLKCQGTRMSTIPGSGGIVCACEACNGTGEVEASA